MEGKKLIETYVHDGEGYNPYLMGPKWQVAQLNYSLEEALESKIRLDIHHYTDESFLLIDGVAVLIGAEIDNCEIKYDIVRMQPGILYNIPREMWHNIVLKPGGKVLIIEDAGTHLPHPDGDYEFHYFSDVQKEEFRREVSTVLEKE